MQVAPKWNNCVFKQNSWHDLHQMYVVYFCTVAKKKFLVNVDLCEIQFISLSTFDFWLAQISFMLDVSEVITVLPFLCKINQEIWFLQNVASVTPKVKVRTRKCFSENS